MLDLLTHRAAHETAAGHHRHMLVVSKNPVLLKSDLPISTHYLTGLLSPVFHSKLLQEYLRENTFIQASHQSHFTKLLGLCFLASTVHNQSFFAHSEVI